jgi:hypothetical protein
MVNCSLEDVSLSPPVLLLRVTITFNLDKNHPSHRVAKYVNRS